ncbi:MAG: IS110 family transposase [Anaerolinea sp.]|nr:IS110 family transposase [Anaerolinea sp.]
MTKTSTATRQGNDGGMTVGVDVSDGFSSICILDREGEVLEEGRVRTTSEGMGQRFGAMAPCRVVIEAGTHSPWLSRLLSGLGHEVVVANARKVRLIGESTQKTDRADAETLARLGRLDPKLLSPVAHRPVEMQVDLAVIRSRAALVAARSLLVNQVRGTVKAMGGRLPSCSTRSFHHKVLGAIPEPLLIAVTPVLAVIEQLSKEIDGVDARIGALIKESYPEARLLMQVDGVGPLISLTYVLTLFDPHRFQRSRQVGPFLGMTPRQRASGERSPRLGISKTGNGYLRQLLVNGAHYILGPFGKDCDLRRFGLAHAGTTGNTKKRAIVAVA